MRYDGRKGMTVRGEGQVHRESVRAPTERGESLLTECRWETGCCVLTACALLHRNTRRIKGLYVRSLRVGSRRDAGRAGPGCAALDKPGPFIPQLCYDLSWLSRSTWSDSVDNAALCTEHYITCVCASYTLCGLLVRLLFRLCIHREERRDDDGTNGTEV